MYCQYCGKENKDGQKFCKYCGNSFQNDPKRKEERHHHRAKEDQGRTRNLKYAGKSPVTSGLSGVNKILILAAAVLGVVTVVAIGLVVKLYLGHGEEKNSQTADNFVMEEQSKLSEQDAGNPDEKVAEGDDPAMEIRTDTARTAVEEINANGEERDLFVRYLNEKLVPMFGVFRSPQEGVLHGIAESEWLDPDGMFCASIYDFDKDGDEEMLIVVNREISKYAPLEDSDPTALSLVMYENENGVIQLSDAIVFGAGGEYDHETEKKSLSPDEWCGIRYAVSVTEIDGQVYLLCEDYTVALNFGDGMEQNYWALTYHDKSLKYAWSFSQNGPGSSGFVFRGYDYLDGECVHSEICYSEEEPEKTDEAYRDMYLDEALTTFIGKHGINVGQELSLYWTDGLVKSIYSDNPDVTRLFELKNECINEDYEAGEYQYRVTNLLYGELLKDQAS